jgi:hypothetical protein
MLGLSMLFATALCALGDRWSRRRRLLLVVTTAVMLFELLPAPRPLYSATVPRFYERVAQAPEGTRLLELPLGVRDGTSSVGNFTARSQFFQTVHGKPLIGGYLSRVSHRRVQEMHQDPMLDALMTLSEGGTLDTPRAGRLIEGGPQFLQRTRIRFVVIDTARTSLALREFAAHAFRLVRVDGEGPYELYSTNGAAVLLDDGGNDQQERDQPKSVDVRRGVADRVEGGQNRPGQP